MADGSITIAALLDTGAFQSSVTALENELSSLSVRLQGAVSAAAAAGTGSAMTSMIGSINQALDGLRITAGTAAQGAAQAAILSFSSGDWTGTGARASGSLASGFQSGISRISEAASRTAQTAKNAFQGDWYTIGSNISSHIAAGISASAGSVTAAMASVASKAMAEAKDILQIRSPSAKMREEVGVMLSRGIAEGILAGQSYIESALAETGKSIHAPVMQAAAEGTRSYQQNIYLQGSTTSPYQAARAIRQQSELMMRT